jgi:hypothetical protein
MVSSPWFARRFHRVLVFERARRFAPIRHHEQGDVKDARGSRDSYASRPVTSVLAADIESAVLDHERKLLAAPELIAPTWVTAKRQRGDGPPRRLRHGLERAVPR